LNTQGNNPIQKNKKTATELEVWIKITILGLMANPNYSDLGRELQRLYDEYFYE
jgi:hypothetical protein